MAWTSWPLNIAQKRDIVFGVLGFGSLDGLVVTVRSSPSLDGLLNSPITAGLVEIKDQRLTAVGSAPDFPVTPKWRKVVRTIG